MANKKEIYRNLGVTGIKQNSGMVFEQPLKQLQGHSGIKIFTEMYYIDPVCGAIMFAIEQIVRSGEWSAKPASQDEKDKKAAKFVNQCMDDMQMTWEDVVSDALTVFPYGWAFFEIVYKVRRGRKGINHRLNSKHDDGKIGWQKISLRSQRSWEKWEIEEGTGDVLGMHQYDEHLRDDSQSQYLPLRANGGIAKGLLLKTKHAGGNPEGVSLFTNAYRPWLIKKRLEEVEGVGIERDLAGLPVLIPPEDWDWDEEENVPVLAWAKELITNLRRDEYEGVILPNANWDLKLLSAISARTHNTSEIINRYDKRIAMTSLGQFIMLGLDRAGGSYALVDSWEDLWKTAVQGHLNGMAGTFNKDAVPSLLELNPEFSKLKEYPRIHPNRVNIPSLVDLANYINGIAGNNIVNFDHQDIREELMRMGRMPTVGQEKKPEIEIPKGMGANSPGGQNPAGQLPRNRPSTGGKNPGQKKNSPDRGKKGRG